MERVAESLETLISTQQGVRGEEIATRQAIAQNLAMMGQRLDDLAAIGQGVGGVAPLKPLNFEARREAVQSMRNFNPRGPALPKPARELPPLDMTPAGGRTRLTDYELDPGRPLGPQTREGLRRGVYASMASRANEASAAHDATAASYIDVETGAATRLRPGVRHNWLTGQFFDSFGNEIRSEDGIESVLSADEYASTRRSSARRAFATGTAATVAKGWSEGQPIGRAVMSALPANALKVAGYAGLGVAAADRTWKFAQNQHEANRSFQEIYGGGNAEYFGDRADQWFNKNIRGRFSMLGAENYDRLFSGAMNMGLRDDDRGDYIDAGAEIMRTGVNAQQTQRVLDMSIEAGLGLQGLTEAIKQVNQAARDAGVNAARARETFIANYEASSEIMFGDQSAKDLATYATMGQLGMARPYQNISTMPMLTNQNMQYMQAHRQGLTVPELMAQQMDNPAEALYHNEEMLRGVLDMLPGTNGARPIRVIVEEFLAENNGNYDAGRDQPELGRRLRDDGWDPYYLVTMLSEYGVRVSVGEVYGYVANLYTKDAPGNVAVQAAQEKARQLTTPEAIPSTGTSEDGATFTDQFGVLRDAPGIAIDDSIFNWASDDRDLRMEYLRGLSGNTDLQAQTDDWWKELSDKEMNPAVKAFLDEAQALGLSPNTMVRVKTLDGKDESFPLGDVLRYFPDQIASGQAQLVGGVKDNVLNQTVAEAMGFSQEVVDANPITSSTESVPDAHRGRGMDFYDWAASQSTGTGTSATKDEPQTMVLELTEDAKRWLQIRDDELHMSPTAPGWDGHSIEGG